MIGPKLPTFAEMKSLLREHGISVRKNDGEYRINFIDGDEATAYYTNDKLDAIHTAMIMEGYQ